jgi:RHS repeat-associated protein
VEVNGSTVIGPVTNTAFTSGNAGVWSYAPTSAGSHRFDNFSVTMLGGGFTGASKVLALRVYTKVERRILAAVTPPSTGLTYRVYYYAGGRPIAMRVLPPNDATGTVHYLLSDHLGSMSASVDPNLNVTRQYFYPYGGVRSGSGTLPTAKGFTGQYSDATGLMYFNARYYSQTLGRFVSADSIVARPSNPQAFNRYSYVYNSPVNFTDSTGHCVDNDLNQTNGDYLNCTELELSRLNWDVRIWWIRKLGQAGWADGWFENIVAILRAFQGDSDFSNLRSWASIADAGLLWTIQDGYTAIRDSKPASSAPGELWAQFFKASQDRADRSTRRSLWGAAEIAGTTYGRYYAEDVRRVPFPSGVAGYMLNAFIEIGNGYREKLAKGTCNGCTLGNAIAYAAVDAWDWVFRVDTSSPESGVAVTLGAQYAFFTAEVMYGKDEFDKTGWVR